MGRRQVRGGYLNSSARIAQSFASRSFLSATVRSGFLGSLWQSSTASSPKGWLMAFR